MLRAFTGTGTGFRLSAGGKDSEPFDVSATSPYGRLAEESFDYFKDHRAPETVFEKFLHDWTKGRIAGPFWYDAGDKGYPKRFPPRSSAGGRVIPVTACRA